jgi:hypothetical protein
MMQMMHKPRLSITEAQQSTPSHDTPLDRLGIATEADLQQQQQQKAKSVAMNRHAVVIERIGLFFTSSGLRVWHSRDKAPHTNASNFIA